MPSTRSILLTHGTLGKQARRAKDSKAAELYQRKAIVLEPTRTEAHIELGNLLLANSRWEEAAACYEKGIELSPDGSVRYSNLGSTLSDLVRTRKPLRRFVRQSSYGPITRKRSTSWAKS